jgi:hypothetical protein
MSVFKKKKTVFTRKLKFESKGEAIKNYFFLAQRCVVLKIGHFVK